MLRFHNVASYFCQRRHSRDRLLSVLNTVTDHPLCCRHFPTCDKVVTGHPLCWQNCHQCDRPPTVLSTLSPLHWPTSVVTTVYSHQTMCHGFFNSSNDTFSQIVHRCENATKLVIKLCHPVVTYCTSMKPFDSGQISRTDRSVRIQSVVSHWSIHILCALINVTSISTDVTNHRVKHVFVIKSSPHVQNTWWQNTPSTVDFLTQLGDIII